MTAANVIPAAPPDSLPSRRMARTLATLILFVVSVALGIAIHVALSTPPPPVERFPTIAHGVAEPQTSAALVRAIEANDPQALAAAYSADLLSAFQEAIAPVVQVSEMRYQGGVEKDGETLASYVASGVDQQGQSVISGIVIHVKDGQITSFN
jgi:hypothetical protein